MVYGTTRLVLPYRHVPDSYLWDTSRSVPVRVADAFCWATLDTVDRLARGET